MFLAAMFAAKGGRRGFSMAQMRGRLRCGRNVFLVLLLSFVLLRSWNLSTVQMPFNGWDEFNHIAASYFVHTNGKMPKSTDILDADITRFFATQPHPSSSALFFQYKVPLYPGLRMGDDSINALCCRHFKISDSNEVQIYQAQHGPLYYTLMASIVKGKDPPSLLRWADTGRLVNMACYMLTILLFYRILRKAAAAYAHPLLTYGVVTLFASFAYTSFNFSRFSNDGLALLLGCTALLAHMTFFSPEKYGLKRLLLTAYGVGALTGCAVLAKATAMPLVPALCVAMAAYAMRLRRPWLLACAAALVVGYAAVAGGYHLHNYLEYGQLTGMQEAVHNKRNGLGLLDAVAAVLRAPWPPGEVFQALTSNPLLYKMLTFVGGWSNIPNAHALSTLFRLGVLGCVLAGLASLRAAPARAVTARLLRQSPELPLLLAFATLGLLFHSLHSFLAFGYAATGGWYAMLATPVLFAALLLGPALLGRVAGVSAFLWFFALFNVSYYAGLADLARYETGITAVLDALAQTVNYHCLFTVPPLPLLALELTLLAALGGLCCKRIWDFHGNPAAIPAGPERIYA